LLRIRRAGFEYRSGLYVSHFKAARHDAEDGPAPPGGAGCSTRSPGQLEALPEPSRRSRLSHDFDSLSLADGATFRSLPAKNITFSLMANAAHVADRIA
jgi:hypothetical protein